MRRASRSCLVLLQSTNSTPSRTLLGHLFPSNTNFSLLPGQSTSILLAQDTFLGSGRYLQRPLSLRNLCYQSRRAHMRLCLTPVSKRRLRPSCDKQDRAAGLPGRTRIICPKRRPTETTSVAFSNSPCKSRLLSLPMADMAFSKCSDFTSIPSYPLQV